MAPKRCYDAGRLGKAAEEAATRAQASFNNDVVFTCRCDGVVGDGKFKQTAMVQFTWRAVAGEFNEEHAVQVRCDNARAKGIPLPEPLKEALRRRRLEQTTQEPEKWQGRLEEAAEGAAMRARASLGSGVVLTCICASAVNGCKLTKKTMARFTWRLVAGEFNEERVVHVRCDNACARGVPLQEILRGACRRAQMAQAAATAEGGVEFDGAVVTCRFDYAPSILHVRVC